MVGQHESLKDRLIGTWALVSWEQKKSDGSKVQRYGSNPTGIAFFDAGGRTYSVTEANSSIAIHIEGSSFPNWNGAKQERIVAITEEQLTLTVRPPSGETVDVIWKRAN